METLQISKENALKAYDQAGEKTKKVLANLFGEKIFVKNIIERIKTLEDALEYNGETLEQFEARTIKDSNDERAYKALKAIALALNEGTPMDYTDTDVYKYYPWFNAVGSGSGFSFRVCAYGFSFSLVGARLCVNTREKAEYMGKQFIEIYNTYING